MKWHLEWGLEKCHIMRMLRMCHLHCVTSSFILRKMLLFIHYWHVSHEIKPPVLVIFCRKGRTNQMDCTGGQWNSNGSAKPSPAPSNKLSITDVSKSPIALWYFFIMLSVRIICYPQDSSLKTCRCKTSKLCNTALFWFFLINDSADLLNFFAAHWLGVGWHRMAVSTSAPVIVSKPFNMAIRWIWWGYFFICIDLWLKLIGSDAKSNVSFMWIIERSWSSRRINNAIVTKTLHIYTSLHITRLFGWPRDVTSGRSLDIAWFYFLLFVSTLSIPSYPSTSPCTEI